MVAGGANGGERGRGAAVVDRRDGMPVLRFAGPGDWDSCALALVGAAAWESTADGRRRIGLDLSAIDRLPDDFLTVLVAWHARGLEVFVYDPPGDIRESSWFRSVARPAGKAAWRLSRVAPADAAVRSLN